MSDQMPLSGQLATLLGVVSQMYASRMDRLLEPHGLSLSQLSVLSHCSRHADQSWTVSRLAEVMEINQPGITKIVQKLLARDLLTALADPDDARKKHLHITPAGVAELHSIYGALAEDVESWFAGWTLPGMEDFRASLQSLIAWFDSHRLGED